MTGGLRRTGLLEGTVITKNYTCGVPLGHYINGIVVSAAAGDSQRCGAGGRLIIIIILLLSVMLSESEGLPYCSIFIGTMVFPVVSQYTTKFVMSNAIPKLNEHVAQKLCHDDKV